MSFDDSIMFNRLIVIMQIILVPVYFVFFSIYWHADIVYFFDILLSKFLWLRPVLPPWMVTFLVTSGIPIFFSLPWVLPSILKATRIADAYTLMGRALGKVRIDQKLFYGLNAAFTLIFFILPFGSPLITVIGIFVVVRMVMRKLWLGKLSKYFWIIPSLFIVFYPALIAFAFYTNYIILMGQVLVTWNTYIGNIFGIGLSLAIAISLGNFVLFLFEGRKKYQDMAINHGFILLVKMVMFGILLLLFFNDGVDVVNFINYIAVGAALFEMVMRRYHDLNTEKNSTRGIIMVIVFSLVNVLLRYLENFTSVVQSVVIIISGLIFFGLFYLSYKYADDPELIDL